MAKKEKIKDFGHDELAGKLDELKGQLEKLKLQRVFGQVEDNQQIKNIKRDIARLKTIIKEYSLGIRTVPKGKGK